MPHGVGKRKRPKPETKPFNVPGGPKRRVVKGALKGGSVMGIPTLADVGPNPFGKRKPSRAPSGGRTITPQMREKMRQVGRHSAARKSVKTRSASAVSQRATARVKALKGGGFNVSKQVTRTRLTSTAKAVARRRSKSAPVGGSIVNAKGPMRRKPRRKVNV